MKAISDMIILERENMMKLKKLFKSLLIEERATQMGLNVAAAEPLVDLEEFEHTSSRTPELYFGYKFASARKSV